MKEEYRTVVLLNNVMDEQHQVVVRVIDLMMVKFGVSIYELDRFGEHDCAERQ